VIEGMAHVWSYKKDIYRGVAQKYKDSPFTASAMRYNEIVHLEQYFSHMYSKSTLLDLKTKLNSLPAIPFFQDASPLCPWSWFLSSIHIILEAKRNPSLLEPLQYLQIYGVSSVFESMVTVDSELLPELMFRTTRETFSKTEEYDVLIQDALSYTTVSAMVYGYEYFQHINYDLRGDLNYNPFPTMVMDWTEDIIIANRFSYSGEEAGLVLSLDYDKYKQLLYDEWYPLIVHAGIASTTPGFTPYFDYHSIFAAKNTNIQEQKGVVLFWPWDYTIAELLENELGRKIGFKQVPVL